MFALALDFQSIHPLSTSLSNAIVHVGPHHPLAGESAPPVRNVGGNLRILNIITSELLDWVLRYRHIASPLHLYSSFSSLPSHCRFLIPPAPAVLSPVAAGDQHSLQLNWNCTMIHVDEVAI